MSVDVDIIFEFNKPIVPSAFVKAILDFGWGAEADGSISLLSPDAHRAAHGDWEIIEDADIAYLLRWVMSFDDSDGVLGFVLAHQETGIGGPLFLSEDRCSLSWAVQINIPHLFSHRNMIDFTQCFSVICPAIYSLGLDITRVDVSAV